MQLRAAVVVSLAALVLTATACNDDGRNLRPARPDQIASVSTLAPVTDPAVGDGIDTGFGDGFDTVPISSSPAPADPVLTASFAAGGPIDPRTTCQGENLSPTLSWSAAPTGTVEIAITMTDLDAPAFVHWAIAGIDPLSTSLGEGVVPEYSMQGINGTGQPGYTGPCPPAGDTHTYEFTVHFLAQQTELGDGAAGADLIAAIEGATFASASVTGTYSQS
jgi:Raf kinase inhibitor-like YbhB/YbcL family protein